ncbi:PP2C family protein-serine/threonine phosphatase [Halobacillus amylolyticus]|uniref:PP2C family protein-serine/threonine phosphatase n=1 Tax=Halobacillus amylolyticus TaxID=2932259 RepID=A0ABY4H638_9BACI|nr:PP2C family protein-serine/threonine phosphatase [Halobacillus amylolyticus]UOR10315.1 PP2C family protein-serine/threonine phosphatase [Halobacillus amylolyticus]
MNTLKLDLENYKELMQEYIKTKDEQALYQAEQFSKHSMQHNISPEEIVNVHIESLQDLYPNMPEYIQSSLNFLLETMISYGMAYQEHQSMKEKQLELKSEISVAANMQRTLLSTVKPERQDLEVGALSVPAKQMNGDYHHFVEDNNGSLGIAIADVIGKGVPAALCMSMIKYSMDSFPEMRMDPSVILGSLNRVVERNIDPSMFITMFYGMYDIANHTFQYSTAGHEPGFYYNKSEDKFEEIEASGLVLGVSPETTYQKYSKQINVGDMMVLLTDGVTECRQGDRFIEQEEILEVIREYSHLPAQETVEHVYKHFERLQDFQLRDDFTLIILRRNV